MARAITIYIPQGFRQKVKWTPVEQHRVIEFPTDKEKSA